MEFSHLPVLPSECIEGLNISPDGIYADGTTGGGGHSFLIAQQLSDKGRLICIDRDIEAHAAAKIRLAPFLDKITFIQSNFSELKSVLKQKDISEVNGILFDFGVSSYQLDNAERGFSYMHDAPLDMRMDQSESLCAFDVVNKYPREELQRVLWDYGEERFSGRIARAIESARAEKPIKTTLELSDIIRSAMPAQARREAQHPAKRSFQAIRIEVNGELAAIQSAVNAAIDTLGSGGRIATISFHSLEDRIVKNIFAERAKGCTCPPNFPICVCGKKPQIKLISKGVITATQEELEQNPRSRSAKLRVAEKI